MWNLFKNLLKEDEAYRVRVIPEAPTRQEPAVQQDSVKLREPVQVLLDSLEEGWWDFKTEKFLSGYGGCLIATHEWLQTKLHVHNTMVGTKPYRTSSGYETVEGVYEYFLRESWMSTEENRLVKEAILKANNSLQKKREQRKVEVREAQFFKLLELKGQQ